MLNCMLNSPTLFTATSQLILVVVVVFVFENVENARTVMLAVCHGQMMGIVKQRVG